MAEKQKPIFFYIKCTFSQSILPYLEDIGGLETVFHSIMAFLWHRTEKSAKFLGEDKKQRP